MTTKPMKLKLTDEQLAELLLDYAIHGRDGQARARFTIADWRYIVSIANIDTSEAKR